MQPDSLRTRILLWTEEEIRLDRLPPKSGAILEAVLYRGELPRGDAAGIVGTGDRQARRVVSALIDRGVLVSESTRAPLAPGFPGRAGITLDAGAVSRANWRPTVNCGCTRTPRSLRERKGAVTSGRKFE